MKEAGKARKKTGIPPFVHMPTTEYAAYKGDDLLCIGSLEEVAEELGIIAETVKFYTTPSHTRRVEKAKRPERCVRVLVMNDDDEDDDED